jgi:hypothetical protein
MAPQNLRLGVVYGTARVGLGSAGTATESFIDASRSPLNAERKGQRYTFGCELVVTDTTQSAFDAKCNALEAAFDASQARHGTFVLTSDTIVYELMDPNGGWAFFFNGAVANGNTFTITVNGGASVLTAGSDFSTTGDVIANLAASIVFWNPSLTTFAFGSTLYVYAKNATVVSLALSTNATFVSVTHAGTLAFNADCSIAKRGSEDDTALSRRYAIEVAFDLAYTESGKNGRHASKVQVLETDARRKRLVLSGAFTALGSNTAFEQYLASIDTYAASIQTALGGTWEGPFDVKADLDDNYAAAAGNKLGRLLTYSRTYEELIYNQSKGTLDDVRLRRQVLEISKALEAPGDYGPGGTPVLRLQRGTVKYAAAVDKTQTQDLKGIYESTVKPFLIDEAAKAFGTNAMALVFHEPTLDRAQNRIACSMQVLAASSSGLIQSTIVTRDEDDAGKTLVAVWDDDPYSKEEFQGPKTLRRTVTQTYTVLGPPSGAAATSTSRQGSDQFGVFAINGPRSLDISAPNDNEAQIDSFFGLNTGSSRKGGDAAFATSGGVPEPRGFKAVYRNGVAVIEPRKLGRAGDPQLDVTLITKIKVFEYIHAPTGTSSPSRTPTLRDRAPDGGAGGSLTVSR